MVLNTKMCKPVPFSKANTKFKSSNVIGSIALEIVNSCKNLGVHITFDL